MRILHTAFICMQNLYVLRRLGNLSHGDSSRIFDAMRLDSFCFILHNFMLALISLMVNCEFLFASYVFNLAFYQPVYVLLIHWCIPNRLHDGKPIPFIMHYVFVTIIAIVFFKHPLAPHTGLSQNDLCENNMQSTCVARTINNPCAGISRTKLEALFEFLTSYSSNNRGGTRLRIVTGSVGENASKSY